MFVFVWFADVAPSSARASSTFSAFFAGPLWGALENSPCDAWDYAGKCRSTISPLKGEQAMIGDYMRKLTRGRPERSAWAVWNIRIGSCRAHQWENP